MAERNAKLIAATRANKVAAAERKRAAVLLHSVSVRVLARRSVCKDLARGSACCWDLACSLCCSPSQTRQAGGMALSPTLSACRKHALAMLLQSKDACKNRFWLVEDDLKRGTAVKADKSGKAILTILRHLGRLQEVNLAAASASSTNL